MLLRNSILSISLAVCILQCIQVYGQELEIEWERLYLAAPDSFACIVRPFALFPSGEDGFIIGSKVGMLDGPTLSRIFNVDSEGEIIWEYVNQESTAGSKGLIKLDNGEYLFLTRRRTGELGGHPQIIRLDESGEEIWRRTYISDFWDYPFNMFKTEQNNIIMVGKRRIEIGVYVSFLYKLNQNGDVLEFRTYDFIISTGCQISDNSLLFTSFVRDGPIASDVALFETDIHLDSIRYDIYESNSELSAGKIIKKPNGSIIVAGYEYVPIDSQSQVTTTNICLSEFNADRELLWLNVYGHRERSEIYHDLLLFPDNRIAFSGGTFSQGFFLLADPEGNVIDSLLENGLGWAEFEKMLLTQDGSLYISGATRESMNDSLFYIRLVRVSYPNSIQEPDISYPRDFRILSAYPNPFNSMTTISYQLRTRAVTNIKISDFSGRDVATLLSRNLKAGYHTLTWNAEELPSGMYIFRMEAGGFVKSRKLVLLR